MHDLDTAQLRRKAAESSRRTQKQLRVMLLVIHGSLYFAALAVMAAVLFVMPWVFDSLWNNIDLSLVVFGLFVGWGIGLLLHGAGLAVDSAWAERRLRQQAVSEALGRALLEDVDDLELDEPKAKRGLEDLTEIALSDDGELIAKDAEINVKYQ